MKLVRTAILTTLTTLLLSLSLTTPSWAQWGFPPQQPAVSEQDVQELQHQLDLMKKDFERLEQQSARDLDAHKERISDLHALADWFGLLVAFLTIVVALGVGFSYLSATRSAVRKAKEWLLEDAKAEAQQLSEDLVKKSRSELKKHIAELEQELHSKIDEQSDAAMDGLAGAIADIEKKHLEAEAILARAQEAMQKGSGSKISDSDKQALSKAAQDTAAKPKSEWTYEDWWVRATEAYFVGDFKATASALDRAMQAADASQEQVAKALVNKGLALGEDGRTAEELAAYEAVENRFGRSEVSALGEWVAKALVNKGVVLSEDGRTAEALVAYKAVEDRFGKSEDPEQRVWVATALVNKGVALRKDGRVAEELTAYEAVEDRFGRSEDPALHVQIAKALVGKGVVLHQDGRRAEAVAVYGAVGDRFGNSEDPALREFVAKARGGRGFTLLTLAKEAGQMTDGEGEARALLEKALADIEASLVDQPDDLVQLGNQGYALFLLGREDEAEAPLRSALGSGRKEAFNNAMDDAQIHPVPEDKAFVALVERLWAEVQAAQSDD